MQSKRRVSVLCVGSFCGMFKASSASKQQVQEYRERAQARDCQQPRLLLGKRLPSSPTPFKPCCRTPSEGGGCSPVSRCRPEPSHSRSGPFRRPGLPGESAGPKRNGNMKSIFLRCSCVGVAVVECFFFWLRNTTTKGPVMYIRNDVVYLDRRPSFCGRCTSANCHRVAEVARKPLGRESTMS